MVALTEVEILRADTDLLDIMLMWDQLSGMRPVAARPAASGLFT
ncbi:hypothetical protein [Methylotenera sp. G11]|nr:hypothetical protein [Methylotenera sp. G11]